MKTEISGGKHHYSREADLCGFEAYLVYKVNFRTGYKPIEKPFLKTNKMKSVAAKKSIRYGLEEGKRENDVIILDSQE